MIGLQQGTVRLSAFSSEWRLLFEKECKSLLHILAPYVVAIEHIGSTAMPDMRAKPIVDMAVAVRSEDDIPKCIEPLTRAGYEYKGEYGLPGRHFFIKGEPTSYNLHLVRSGSPHWKSWLLFRNYLVEHKDIANRYSALKEALAQRYSQDRGAYTKAKGAFIASLLTRITSKPPSGQSS